MNMTSSITAGIVSVSMAASMPIMVRDFPNREGSFAYIFPVQGDTKTRVLHALEGGENALINFSAIENQKKLSEIEKLKDNWNGYGATPFETQVIRNAHVMLLALKDQPFLAPTARDSIQMEFEKENGDYFEIEVYAQKISVYSVIGNKETEKEYPVDAASITEIAEKAAQFNG